MSIQLNSYHLKAWRIAAEVACKTCHLLPTDNYKVIIFELPVWYSVKVRRYLQTQLTETHHI